MISIGLRKGVLRTAFVSLRQISSPPSKQLILWNQIKQQVLVSSSVSEINSLVRGVVDNHIEERDVFFVLGAPICERVEKLISSHSAAELLEAAKSVPCGTLDVLVQCLVKKFTLNLSELISLCGTLASRCSEDYVYDFTCLQPLFDQVQLDEKAKLLSDEFVFFLESATTVAGKFGPLDISVLAHHAIHHCVQSQYDANNQLRLLKLLSVCPESSILGPRAKLFQQLCSDLVRSAPSLRPASLVLVLQCLSSMRALGPDSDLAMLCCTLLQNRLSDLSFPVLCQLTEVQHTPALKVSLAKCIEARLPFLSGDPVVMGLHALACLNSLSNGVLDELGHNFKHVSISKRRFMDLLSVEAMASKLDNVAPDKLALLVVTCLWQQGKQLINCIPCAVGVIDFVHRTNSVVSPSVVESALNMLLETKETTAHHMSSILTGVCALAQLDAEALHRITEHLMSVSKDVHFSPSSLNPDLLADFVRVFEHMHHFVGNWLKECALYATSEVSSLCATRKGCRVVADLAALLVKHNTPVPEFVGAVYYCLVDAESRPSSLSLRADEHSNLDDWIASICDVVTLAWVCTHYRLGADSLAPLVKQCVTIGAVRSMPLTTLERLVEFKSFCSLLQNGTVLESRAEEECLTRLRASCCDLSYRKQECIRSLTTTLKNDPFTVLPSAHSEHGLHLDALVVPDSLNLEWVGGRHSLKVNNAAVVVDVVDDTMLPTTIRPRPSSRFFMLSTLGYSVVHISLRNWRSHRGSSEFWYKKLNKQTAKDVSPATSK